MAAAAVHEDPMATAQDVQQQLATIKAPGTFATRRSSPADDLCLEVTDVGRIGWPITRETARKLCAVARPARYGLKDETRPSVISSNCCRGKSSASPAPCSTSFPMSRCIRLASARLIAPRASFCFLVQPALVRPAQSRHLP